MAGSSTALMSPIEEALCSSRLLGSSFGSLSSPRKGRLEISKTYKQASELFLTRRLSEAFATLEPLITVPQPSEETTEEDTPRRAPVTAASRKYRIKVWILYLTLLNAIAELGPDDGKAAFGGNTWKDLIGRIQDGTVWDQVVDVGYEGNEGKVDAVVVASLATLLLAQSETQKSNQQRLESYLSTSSDPNLDLVDHLETSHTLDDRTGGEMHHVNGTNTPRELNARVNIIEIYTLHVLPRNGEWKYAKDFINMNSLLDEELRERLLQDLQRLEDEESRREEDFEDAMPEQRYLIEQDPIPAEETERDSIDTVRQIQAATDHRPNSQTDYGIDQAQPPENPKSSPPSTQPSPKATKVPQSRPSRSPPIKAPRKPASTNIYKSSVAALSALQNVMSRMASQMSHNPMGLLRLVLFLVGLIAAFSRRDVKDRLGRLTRTGWDKVRRTVGMGVKVSYI